MFPIALHIFTPYCLAGGSTSMYIICKGWGQRGSMTKNAFILGEREEAYLGFYVGIECPHVPKSIGVKPIKWLPSEGKIKNNGGLRNHLTRDGYMEPLLAVLKKWGKA